MKPLLVVAGAVVLLFRTGSWGDGHLAGNCLLSDLLAGAKIRDFPLLLCVCGVTYIAVLKPYVLERLLLTGTMGGGKCVQRWYQLTQALIAFGRGEWFGVGLGNSIQKLYAA